MSETRSQATEMLERELEQARRTARNVAESLTEDLQYITGLLARGETGGSWRLRSCAGDLALLTAQIARIEGMTKAMLLLTAQTTEELESHSG